MESELLFVQKYPAHGYEVRTKLVDNPEEGKDPIKMWNAYTAAGDYIGDRLTAAYLCEEIKIAPEKITPDSNICSIGFCDSDQKWYGWSHRALLGFGIGSSVKKEDSAYVPSDVKELQNNYIEWNEYVDVVDDETIRISRIMCDVVGEHEDGSLILKESDKLDHYDVKTGRGEWKAETLEDAKQMAIDFANSVA